MARKSVPHLIAVALLLAACSPSSPTTAPTPAPTVSPPPPATVTAKELTQCRDAAREGLGTYQLAVQVSDGSATKAEFHAQYQEAYVAADHDCSEQLQKHGSAEVPVSCELAGAAAATAAFLLRDELTAESEQDQKAARKGREKALRQAAGYWGGCFPNGKIPEEFRV